MIDLHSLAHVAFDLVYHCFSLVRDNKLTVTLLVKCETIAFWCEFDLQHNK